MPLGAHTKEEGCVRMLHKKLGVVMLPCYSCL